MLTEELVRTAVRLTDACRDAGLSIVTAESCTGGLIAACLTEVPGVSDVFERGFVTYSNYAKTEHLGIHIDWFDKYGAVSEEVARAMAEGALKNSLAEISIATTGIAGPGGAMPGKPVGTVHIACGRWHGENRDKIVTFHRRYEFGDSGRTDVRRKTVMAGLEMALSTLSGPSLVN